MANIFLREPVYITVQQVRDTTAKADLIALTDDEIKVLIAKSEDLIDNYIWSYGTPFDEDQSLIFPIDVDWISTIPSDITQATFYTVEQIFENGDSITGSVSTWSGAIISEKAGDRTVSYDVKTTTTWSITKQLWLPNEAINILKAYKKIFYVSKI